MATTAVCIEDGFECRGSSADMEGARTFVKRIFVVVLDNEEDLKSGPPVAGRRRALQAAADFGEVFMVTFAVPKEASLEGTNDKGHT